MIREITAEQLKQGYRVQVMSANFMTGSFDLEGEMHIERREYKVIRKTEHGTYIVEEP